MGSPEELHCSSLLVGNVDNCPSGQAKVVVGSLQGHLRVYLPRRPEFRVEDLLLEEQLPGAILQLALGSFIPGAPDQRALAVLFPHRLGVYTVTAVSGAEGGGGGGGSRAQYLVLARAYEHGLGISGQHFTAFNMACGSFGGAGRDLLAVQSMDGRLQVFEQDAPGFTRRLGDALLPGPLLYVADGDLLVSCSAENFVEAYRYGALLSAEDGGGRRAAAAWSVNVGEVISDLRLLSTGDERRILCLGQRHIFLAGLRGQLHAQKRLEYDPLCVCCYGDGGRFLVTSADGRVFVYRGLQVAWAASLHHPAIGIGVGTFGAAKGLLCILDAQGHLRLSYLGTEPPSSAVGAASTQEPDFEQIEAEHRALLRRIRDAHLRSSATHHQQLMVKCVVPPQINNDSALSAADRAALLDADAEALSAPSVVVKAFLRWSGADAAEDLSLSVSPPDFVTCDTTSTNLGTLRGGGAAGTPLQVDLHFRCDRRVLPASLEVRVACSCKDRAGGRHVAATSFRLPLAVACRLVAPVKRSDFRFTIDTDREPCSLLQLFDDMLAQPGMDDEAVARAAGGAGGTALSFQYYHEEPSGPAIATVLVSKSGGRYRVQARSLASLWLVGSELERRLRSKFEGRVRVSCAEEPPLDGLFAHVDAHFARRGELRAWEAELRDAAHQFRVIQKRLLVRFKDKTPMPLNKMDALLVDTYERLLALAASVDAAQRALLAAAASLGCATRLVTSRMTMAFGLDAANTAALEAYLSPEVRDGDQVGWEEQVDAALAFLLRTALARKQRDVPRAPPAPAAPAPLEDTAKLKRRIRALRDRLRDGARIVGGGADGEEERGAEGERAGPSA